MKPVLEGLIQNLVKAVIFFDPEFHTTRCLKDLILTRNFGTHFEQKNHMYVPDTKLMEGAFF